MISTSPSSPLSNHKRMSQQISKRKQSESSGNNPNINFQMKRAVATKRDVTTNEIGKNALTAKSIRAHVAQAPVGQGGLNSTEQNQMHPQ